MTKNEFSDADYIREIAKGYKSSTIADFAKHEARLSNIARKLDALAASQQQQAAPAVPDQKCLPECDFSALAAAAPAGEEWTYDKNGSGKWEPASASPAPARKVSAKQVDDLIEKHWSNCNFPPWTAARAFAEAVLALTEGGTA